MNTAELFAPPVESWQRLSSSYPKLQLVSTCLFFIVLLPICLIPTFMFLPSWAKVLITLVLLGLAIWAIQRSYRLAKSWGYAERESDLYITHGLWFKSLRVVPYGRMQAIEVQAGPIQRLFKLASVELITASPMSNATIPGLDRETAALLRDRLVERGEIQAAGL